VLFFYWEGAIVYVVARKRRLFMSLHGRDDCVCRCTKRWYHLTYLVL